MNNTPLIDFTNNTSHNFDLISNELQSTSAFEQNVSADLIELFFAANVMQMAIDSMNVSYEIWSSQGEISGTFDTFDMQFKQLQLIMESYKELMQKNVDAIEVIRDEIIQMDETLSTIWQVTN